MMSLEAAIWADDNDAAIHLLHAGSDANHSNSDGLSLLMIAAGLGRSRLVAALLAAGADVLAIEPRMGAAVLHKAVQSGSFDVVALLLDHGAFVDQQSPRLGNTPLMDAVLHKHEGVVALLLDRGARTDIINHWHQTALELALHDGPDAISSLIEAREQVRAEAACSKPIFLAVREGDLDAARTLVEAGADIEERTLITGSPDDDYTPLGLAARDGRTDIVEWLLGAGADPSRLVGLMGGTPAHEAAYAGHAEVIRVLTRMARHAGAARLDIDAQGVYNGLTALHDAVWHGHLEATKALIDAGARRDLLSHSGLTPRDLAALYGYDAIVRMLDAADVPPS